MKSLKQTHYYVQAQEKNKLPSIVYRDKNNYQFIDKKDALKLRDAEKKITPDVLFRVVKVVSQYEAGEWI